MSKELKEKLFHQKKSGWENINKEQKNKIFSVSKSYMEFLNKAKTEREFIKESKKWQMKMDIKIL